MKAGRRGRREALPAPVEILDAEYEEALTDFLFHGEDVEGLSMLSQWDPIGRPCYLRGGELDLLAKELDEVMAGLGVGDVLKRAFDKVASMARRAVAENLILVVLPD